MKRKLILYSLALSSVLISCNEYLPEKNNHERKFIVDLVVKTNDGFPLKVRAHDVKTDKIEVLLINEGVLNTAPVQSDTVLVTYTNYNSRPGWPDWTVNYFLCKRI